MRPEIRKGLTNLERRTERELECEQFRNIWHPPSSRQRWGRRPKSPLTAVSLAVLKPGQVKTRVALCSLLAEAMPVTGYDSIRKLGFGARLLCIDGTPTLVRSAT